LVGPRPDLWHFTNYVAPPTGKPFVQTVFDLTFVEYPEFVEPKNQQFLEKWVPDTLERSTRVITISESTKEGLIEHFKVPSHKIDVTPLAADDIYEREVPDDEIAQVKEKYGIEDEYFLAVGTLEPRKNLKNLLLAVAAMRKGTTDQLVVVGGQGWLFDETQELIGKLGLSGRVIFTDYAPKRELPALYQGAKAFVFPSLYEGFGIPVLEAMSSGTPVVCSNTSSMPEVGGMAALYFDPNDPKALKHALSRVLEDENLRKRLAFAGREQAAKFSWSKTAQHTLGVYERALQTHRRFEQRGR
jgi:glycosyltransferase involved in cell wall biosynthesis